jgi:hypothetical protein
VTEGRDHVERVERVGSVHMRYSINDMALESINLEDKVRSAHLASRGFSTFENSRHEKTPPGLRTRYASASARSMWVTFRIPNAIV